jgi:hypothetical protein
MLVHGNALQEHLVRDRDMKLGCRDNNKQMGT